MTKDREIILKLTEPKMEPIMKIFKQIKAQVQEHIPTDLVTGLLKEGLPEGEIIDEVADALDEIIDWDKVQNPAWKAALEKYDGHVIRFVLKAIIKQIKKSI